MAFKYFPGNVYFITYKTILGEKVFDSDGKKAVLLGQIKKAQKDLSLDLRAFAVLSNHYHILARCSFGGLITKALQRINGGSSYLVQQITGVQRSLWGIEKFSKILYDEDAYWKVFAYVIGNPLKHGLVHDLNELEDYPYCSYKEGLQDFDKGYLRQLILENQKFDFETDTGWDMLYQSAFEPTKVG